MEPSVVVPIRGMVIAALAMTGAMLADPTPETLYGAPFGASLVAAKGAPFACVEGRWLRANHLAWTIAHRRYSEIERAAGSESPYARWVRFVDGAALAPDREHPVELVRIRADAPSAATGRAPW
jgi:hypothetical protein